MKILDKLPLMPLVMMSLLLGLAPFFPEPHLLQKLKMLMGGTLNQTVDILDLLMHGAPVFLLILKLLRMATTKPA